MAEIKGGDPSGQLKDTVKKSLRHGGQPRAWAEGPRTAAGLTELENAASQVLSESVNSTGVVPTASDRRVSQPITADRAASTTNTDGGNENDEQSATAIGDASVRVTLSMFSPNVELCETPFAAH